ncbi:redoxin domain-containing protein, partial [Streptomyces sp. NRRL F-7442]|uniref:redoxin domain-containing protein n=1 Tax=Streptomyces sp. NRRL F-7442 TaxID=1519498 RepID=UPI0006AD9C38
LFFYPAALTTGCTAEACRFRDLAAEFTAVGPPPVGVSKNPVERPQEFAERHALGLPQLDDAAGAVREEFGGKGGFRPMPTERVNFIVGQDPTLLDGGSREIRMNAHPGH